MMAKLGPWTQLALLLLVSASILAATRYSRTTSDRNCDDVAQPGELLSTTSMSLDGRRGLRFDWNFHGVRSEQIVRPWRTDVRRSVTPHVAARASFAVDERHRNLYLSDGLQSIHRGSHTVEVPLALMAFLSRVQDAIGARGAVGEIGVHGGLFFIGMAHLSRAGEQLWCCDVFDDQKKNVDGSGFGVLSYFTKQCRTYGLDRVDVVATSSAALPQVKQGQPFRLISVDGGHTRELTVNDLRFASRNLAEGGIIVLDDVFNVDGWPGVIDGLITFMSLSGVHVGPFFIGHNKAFLSQASHHALFYNSLLKHPFWGGCMDSVPTSNLNPHKSPLSGQNRFALGGYQYLRLNCTDPLLSKRAREVLVEEHGLSTV